MLSPSLVILSEAKNPRSSLRVNSAKHLCSFSHVLEPKATAEILRFAQDDSRLIFSHLQSRCASQSAEPQLVANGNKRNSVK
jgi:hypothetical protein